MKIDKPSVPLASLSDRPKAVTSSKAVSGDVGKPKPANGVKNRSCDRKSEQVSITQTSTQVAAGLDEFVSTKTTKSFIQETNHARPTQPSTTHQ
jgi:hypothetical protein